MGPITHFLLSRNKELVNYIFLALFEKKDKTTKNVEKKKLTFLAHPTIFFAYSLHLYLTLKHKLEKLKQ